jgi:hypothetical protein
MGNTLRKTAKFAAITIAFSMFVLTVSAGYGDYDETTSPPPLPQEPPPLEVIPLPPQWWNDDIDDIPHDFWGNTQLIDSTRVVFESNVLTFISVKTRAGNVFYVLIDHRIPIDEDEGVSNVYFLTQVNEFDLLSLLYRPSDDENAPPLLHPSQTTPTVTQQTPANTYEPDEPPPPATPPLISPFLIIILAVTVLFVVGLFVYLKVAGKNNKSPVQRDEYDDFDDGRQPWEGSYVDDEIDIDNEQSKEE